MSGIQPSNTTDPDQRQARRWLNVPEPEGGGLGELAELKRLPKQAEGWKDC
jgi:hypothetical protein